MTDQEHTKEPWENHNEYIGTIGSNDKFRGIARALAIVEAERIVACVNALAGIDDPEAFMRDVRQMCDNEEHGLYDRGLKMKMLKHLKGGAE